MGSVGSESGARRRKPMWLYPKAQGFNPPERWGHSACFADGVLYVFGGCCGGLRFSDVLTLNLDTMVWNSLVTSGQCPGTRDSHSAALVGQKMVVLGGTNGSKKVNDLHILDLKTKEWSRPNCKGTPPSPRESHSATVVGDNKLVIFGGSGEGEANYLNDVHVLDFGSMTWSSPEIKGDLPAPRDSHTAVTIGNRLLIYGGDCGDRYHGEVDVLDMDTMTWSKLEVQGASPGVRAGHAAVSIGTKVFVIGGVGDRQYYSDVWVLDVTNCSWTQFEIRGHHPQGRFSHTAVVVDTDIAIYGGCGEDEHPLNELIILQLGSEHPIGRYNISMCKIFGSHWNQERCKFTKGNGILTDMSLKNGDLNKSSQEMEVENRSSLLQDTLRSKRRKISDAKTLDVESEQEEHSLSLSTHSSPSQSDQENTAQKLSSSPKNSGLLPSQLTCVRLHSRREHANGMRRRDGTQKTTQGRHGLGVNHPRQEVHYTATEYYKRQQQQQQQPRPLVPPLMGADVRGTIDGAFDSGYLMTANVNGQIFRGILFTPVPITSVPRPPPVQSPGPYTPSPLSIPQHCSTPMHAIPLHVKSMHHQQSPFVFPTCGQNHPRQVPPALVAKSPPTMANNDLKDVVLTLGGPTAGDGKGL